MRDAAGGYTRGRKHIITRNMNKQATGILFRMRGRGEEERGMQGNERGRERREW